MRNRIFLKQLQELAKPPNDYPEECPLYYHTRELKNQFYWSMSWKRIVRKIKARDHFECQVCKSEGRVTLGSLLVHHIRPLEYWPDKRLDETNLITVCQSCHNTIHSADELKWDDEWWG